MVKCNRTVRIWIIWFRDGNFRVCFCNVGEDTVDEAVVDQALSYVCQRRRHTGKDIEGESFVSRRPWGLTYLWQELGYFVAGGGM